MRKKIKSAIKCTVRQLLSLLPSDLLDKISEKTTVDYQVKRLDGKTFFTLLLYGVIKDKRLSTRLLEHYYQTQSFIQLSGKGNHETRHSSIADRLQNIDVRYFKLIFEH